MTPVQHELFDAGRTTDERCVVHGCNATRKAGEQTAPECVIDHERRAGALYVRRPYRCLNAIRPEHQEIPY